MGKPSTRSIRNQLKQLRHIIENHDDEFTRRLAQVAEDTLRWVTEDTDWKGPADDVECCSDILNSEIIRARRAIV